GRARDPLRHRLVDGLGRVLAHEPQPLGTDLAVGLEDRGQPDRTERDREQLRRILADRGRDLRRAAADVEAQRARRLRLALQDPEADEARLLLARDHLEVEPRLLARPADDLLAVAGLADGAGRDRAHARPVPAARRPVGPQGRQQPGRDRARDAAGRENALAGAHGVPLLAHDLQAAVGQNPSHFEAYRVRADVDRRERAVARHHFAIIASCDRELLVSILYPVKYQDPKLYINPH